MPLRVHCPNGCLIRMPSNRAGKIVRCPECKSSIQLSLVSESEIKSGKPIPIEAILVNYDQVCPVIPVETRNEDISDSSDRISEETDSAVLTAIAAAIEAATAEQSPPPREIVALHPETISMKPDLRDAKNQQQKLAEQKSLDTKRDQQESRSADAKLLPRETSQQSKLDVPNELTPRGIQKNKEAHQAKLKMILAIPDAPVTAKPDSVSSFPDPSLRPQLERKIRETVEVIPPCEIVSGSAPSLPWEERIRKANEDRVVLSRLLAVCLCGLALVNMIPALIFWYDWYCAVEQVALPRWVYLQCFIAAIHFVYALYQFQIPDWSAVRAVSVTMLVFAFLFGVLSTGLLVGGGGGVLASFLGVSHTYLQRAAIWCVTMLCLATLVSYLGGREAANWQRSQQLMLEMNLGSSASAKSSVVY